MPNSSVRSLPGTQDHSAIWLASHHARGTLQAAVHPPAFQGLHPTGISLSPVLLAIAYRRNHEVANKNRLSPVLLTIAYRRNHEVANKNRLSPVLLTIAYRRNHEVANKNRLSPVLLTIADRRNHEVANKNRLSPVLLTIADRRNHEVANHAIRILQAAVQSAFQTG